MLDMAHLTGGRNNSHEVGTSRMSVSLAVVTVDLVMIIVGAIMTIPPTIMIWKKRTAHSVHLSEINLLISGIIIYTIVLPIDIIIQISHLLHISLRYQCGLSTFFLHLAETIMFTSLFLIAWQRLKRLWVFANSKQNSLLLSQMVTGGCWCIAVPTLSYVTHLNLSSPLPAIELQICTKTMSNKQAINTAALFMDWYSTAVSTTGFIVIATIYSAFLVKLKRRMQKIVPQPSNDTNLSTSIPKTHHSRSSQTGTMICSTDPVGALELSRGSPRSATRKQRDQLRCQTTSLDSSAHYSQPLYSLLNRSSSCLEASSEQTNIPSNQCCFSRSTKQSLSSDNSKESLPPESYDMIECARQLSQENKSPPHIGSKKGQKQNKTGSVPSDWAQDEDQTSRASKCRRHSVAAANACVNQLDNQSILSFETSSGLEAKDLTTQSVSSVYCLSRASGMGTLPPLSSQGQYYSSAASTSSPRGETMSSMELFLDDDVSQKDESTQGSPTYFHNYPSSTHYESIQMLPGHLQARQSVASADSSSSQTWMFLQRRKQLPPLDHHNPMKHASTQTMETSQTSLFSDRNQTKIGQCHSDISTEPSKTVTYETSSRDSETNPKETRIPKVNVIRPSTDQLGFVSTAVTHTNLSIIKERKMTRAGSARSGSVLTPSIILHQMDSSLPPDIHSQPSNILLLVTLKALGLLLMLVVCMLPIVITTWLRSSLDYNASSYMYWLCRIPEYILYVANSVVYVHQNKALMSQIRQTSPGRDTDRDTERDTERNPQLQHSSN